MGTGVIGWVGGGGGLSKGMCGRGWGQLNTCAGYFETVFTLDQESHLGGTLII